MTLWQLGAIARWGAPNQFRPTGHLGLLARYATSKSIPFCRIACFGASVKPVSTPEKASCL